MKYALDDLKKAIKSLEKNLGDKNYSSVQRELEHDLRVVSTALQILSNNDPASKHLKYGCCKQLEQHIPILQETLKKNRCSSFLTLKEKDLDDFLQQEKQACCVDYLVQELKIKFNNQPRAFFQRLAQIANSHSSGEEKMSRFHLEVTSAAERHLSIKFFGKSDPFKVELNKWYELQKQVIIDPLFPRIAGRISPNP